MAPHTFEPDDSAHFNPIAPTPTSQPLKVLIVGAGIAGLAAATGLRRQGHHVEIFEQSSFANEVGAAIHVCPNASRVLLSWGVDPSKAQFDVARSGLTVHASALKPIYEASFAHIPEEFGAPWYLAHRVDLHNALKELALSEYGQGPPARIHLRSKVTSINPKTGTVELADSSIHEGDLVIAADGVHSTAVSQVIGYETTALPTGSSAFRFLIPTQDILADDRTKGFLEGKDGQMKIFVGSGGTRLISYPCRNGTVENFALIHPDREQYQSKEGWNISTSLSNLLKELEGFHPSLVATAEKASDVKLWKLLYRTPIPLWHKERLLLIGDAAHPMLPHQGQGGAQSIEDGAAIGILLAGLHRDSPDLDGQLAKRLQAFESVRRKRASLIQIFSNAGQDEAEKIRGEATRIAGDGFKIPGNPGEFHHFNFGHDVIKESQKALETL